MAYRLPYYLGIKSDIPVTTETTKGDVGGFNVGDMIYSYIADGFNNLVKLAANVDNKMKNIGDKDVGKQMVDIVNDIYSQAEPDMSSTQKGALNTLRKNIEATASEISSLQLSSNLIASVNTAKGKLGIKSLPYQASKDIAVENDMNMETVRSVIGTKEVDDALNAAYVTAGKTGNAAEIRAAINSLYRSVGLPAKSYKTASKKYAKYLSETQGFTRNYDIENVKRTSRSIKPKKLRNY